VTGVQTCALPISAVQLAFGHYCEQHLSAVSESSLEALQANTTSGDTKPGDQIEALPDGEHLLKAAEHAYRRSLEKSSVWKADPGSRYLCAARLGRLYIEHIRDFKMPPLDLARAIHDTHLDMLLTNERLYQRCPRREGKLLLQARNDRIMERLLETCVYLSEADAVKAAAWRREAFMIAETGKSRLLREEMALADRLPPARIPAELCEQEQHHLDKLRSIYTEIAARPNAWIPQNKDALDESFAERSEARQKLEEIWTQMEHYGGEAQAYISARRDEALQREGLQWDTFQRVADRLGEQVVLISVSQLPEAVLLSVLRTGQDAPELRVARLPQSQLDWYWQNYEEEILARESFRGLPRNSWQRLGEVMFPPLVELLREGDILYFLPQGLFHRLPLHALLLNGTPLITRWAVAYAPSLSVLESTLSRLRREGDVLLMAYASPDDRGREAILKGASQLVRHFQTAQFQTTLKWPSATVQDLREEGRSARVIHLLCHGGFNSAYPLNSYVELADERLTARQWLLLRLQAELVTLSSCEAGILGPQPGDDIVGLTRSILFAGAEALLLPLCRVAIEETGEWMQYFYQCLYDPDCPQGTNKAVAFREATLKVMSEQEDPYYWAPFVLTGNFQ